MKISSKNQSSQLLAGLFTVVLALLSASPAHAQVFLLTIDDSNPGATVFTYTGTSPDIATSTTVGPDLIQNGVDLLGFFTSNVAGFPFVSETTPGTSTLTTGDGSSALTFNQGVVDNYTVPNVDLGLYNADPTATITFTAGQSAFIGTLTLNLSDPVFAGLLPGQGASGNIITGFSTSGAGTNTYIGKWQIVEPVAAPEPATWALLLGSIALLPLLRRCRRA